MGISIDTTTTLDQVNSLCALGQSPMLMNGFLISRLRAHFYIRENLKDAVLQGRNDDDPSALTWRPDPLASHVVIETTGNWEPDKQNSRPAVLVKRNDWDIQSRGIGDKMTGGYGIDYTGRERYATFAVGSHTVFALANTSAMAERLGHEVRGELQQFAPVFRRFFELLRLRVASLGAPMRVEEADGSWAVPVTLSYVIEESWIVEAEGPILQRISIGTVLSNGV